ALLRGALTVALATPYPPRLDSAGRPRKIESTRDAAVLARAESPLPPISRGTIRVMQPGADPDPAAEPAPTLFHVIDPRTFERRLIDELCVLVTRARRVAQTRTGELFRQNLLPTRRALLYFTQPSTRTFLSFHNACDILGIRMSEIRDPLSSSEVKG